MSHSGAVRAASADLGVIAMNGDSDDVKKVVEGLDLDIRELSEPFPLDEVLAVLTSAMPP